MTTNAWSEVVFDGTLNASTKGTTLSGSFEINAEHGITRDDNLFHSFSKFNIHSNETAIFTGPDHIQNVISRVTGLEKSIINGTLSSQMPQANFFLLNPAGIVFGDNATVDVKGSFHVSTADYIVMDNGDSFDIHSSEPVLSTAAPKSFGFLDDSIGKIAFIDHNFFNMNTGKTLSIIGNEIEIKGSYLYFPEGRINIVSVQSAGEITLIDSGIDSTENINRGMITIADYSTIDVSGNGSGNIFIMGSDFFLNKSSLYCITDGFGDGGILSIDVNQMDVSDYSEIKSSAFGGNAGHIDIKTENISLNNYSSISTRTLDMGNAGNIAINALEDITFNEGCIIFSDTQSNGNAGDIQLHANNILFANGSGIGNQTSGKGYGGTISLIAKHSVQFKGTDEHGNASDITTYSNGIGNAGDVFVSGNDILFQDGSRIYASAENAGNGGHIRIHSENGIVELSGVNPNGENRDGFNSCISSQSEQTGKAGDIDINTGVLSIKDGAYISNTTSGNGDSGIIRITSDSLRINGKTPVVSPDNFLLSQLDFEQSQIESRQKKLSGIYSRAEYQDFSDKSGGKIDISSKNMTLFDNGTITTSSTGKRDAGDIDINTNSLTMDTFSSISSESLAKKDGGAAGRIAIQSNDAITIRHHSALTTEAVNTISTDKSVENGKIEMDINDKLLLINGKITTSVKGGAGHGGDIDINAKDVLINHSKIIANAYEGDGGNIHIASDVFLQSVDSLVDASSEKGIDGIIKIESPDTDPSSGLVKLSSNFLDASKWLKNSCSLRSSENISRLIVRGKDATPTKPDDLHSSPAIAFKDLHIKQPGIKPFFTKAESCYQKGDFVAAVKIWHDAEQQLNKNEKDYLTIVTYLIQALQSIGFHHKALALAQKNLPIAEKCQSSSEGILFYNAYGDLLLSLNEIFDAINYLKMALKHAKESKNPVIIASVMNNIANVVIVDDDVRTGIQIYDNALAFLSNDDNNTLKAKIYLNLAYVISMIGSYEESIAAFNEALIFVQQLPDNHDKAFDYISLSQTSLMIHNSFPDKSSLAEQSFELLETAQKIGETINNDRIISMASGHAATILEKSGQYEKALQKTRYAIFTAEQKKYKEILYKWYWQAARLFREMGNETQAIALYQSAISMLTDIREELFNGMRLKIDIFDIDIKPVYLGLAEIYLDQADRENNPKEKEQKILLARDVMESLKNAELSDFFEDECLAIKQQTEPHSFNRTPKGIALLYPIALPERLTVLITLPDGIKHYNLDIPYQELNKLVRTYRKDIQIRSSNQFLAVSQKLYQLLIQPVENDLIAENIHTLLVAPDGVLRLIPFASLHDKEKFLIEKYAIVTIPSINLTDTAISQHKQKMKILVAGLSDAVQDFSALPSVKEELSDINVIMNAQKMVMNDAFTISNVQNEFKDNDYTIVHFATHGVFGGTGKHSFLLTYESHLDMNALEDLMSLGKYRNHQVDMLTLSACQTALGNERAALGLAGVAVKAGVRSAVATLWYVDDQATSLAIRELYRQLKKDNMSKAKALQNAQKMLISKRQYWHPIYWAPFLLIGNWS
jgi:filamentous hemagglutinin family protein